MAELLPPRRWASAPAGAPPVPGAALLVAHPRCHLHRVWRPPGGRSLFLDGGSHCSARQRPPPSVLGLSSSPAASTAFPTDVPLSSASGGLQVTIASPSTTGAAVSNAGDHICPLLDLSSLPTDRNAPHVTSSLTIFFSPTSRRPPFIYCNNVSVVYLSTNPVQHQRKKHVEIDLHFVRERIAADDVRVLSVPSTLQLADIFTKRLPSSVFSEFCSSLNICT